MIAVERQPGIEIRSEDELVVEATDISFQDLDGESVKILVKIRNDGEHRSRATLMKLESAPLGAFVPWQPLAVMAVPPIEAGESSELSLDVKRPHPAPLGDFDQVPPTRLLAVVGSPDEPSPRRSGFAAMLDLLRQIHTGRPPAAGFAATTGSLSPDLWDLLGRGHPHWAGNINIFVGTRAVERHLAKALRVYPGRPNLAMFVVGGRGKRDAYAFDIVGLSPEWGAALFDMTSARTLLVGASDTPIQETQWVETDGALMIMLLTRPPAGCEQGNVEVRVTRRSCQKTAVVEFNLDPAAQGAGCYCA